MIALLEMCIFSLIRRIMPMVSGRLQFKISETHARVLTISPSFCGLFPKLPCNAEWVRETTFDNVYLIHFNHRRHDI